MERSYKTDETGYTYYVQETAGPRFRVKIPAPRQMIRRSCGKWANARIVDECLQDFGLIEERREYRPDGNVVVFGY